MPGRDRRPRVTHHRSLRDLAAKRRPPDPVSRPASGIVAPTRCDERSSAPLQSRAGLGAYFLDVASSPRLLPAKRQRSSVAVGMMSGTRPAMVPAERQCRLGMDVVREATHWPCVCSTVRT